MTTCLTCSTSTAYWRTERQLTSVCSTRFATLRCTKISPGARSMISLGGSRLSEHPIHSSSGFWIDSRRLKNVGSLALACSAQRRFAANRCSRSLTQTVYHSFPELRPPEHESGRRALDGGRQPSLSSSDGGSSPRSSVRSPKSLRRMPYFDISVRRCLRDSPDDRLAIETFISDSVRQRVTYARSNSASRNSLSS